MPTARVQAARLVGRDTELDLATSDLAAVKRGHGRALLVAGDAGIGKTAFLRALGGRLSADGFAVLGGSASETESKLPFGALADVLRAAALEFGSSLVERIVRLKARPLMRLLPELGPSPTAEFGGEARLRVAESFYLLLADLERRSPIAVAVDDLHWVDDGTLEVFLYCARRVAARRVLLIGAYRSDDLGRQQLGAFVADLERSRAVRQIDLRALTVDQTAELITRVLGRQHRVARGLRDTIYERAEGNPFATEEMLRAMVDCGAIVPEKSVWSLSTPNVSFVPRSVHGVVQHRMRQLSAPTVAALRSAAVIGRSFDFDVLRGITGLQHSDLTRSLREGVEAQLINASRGSTNEYRFRHALTREAILADLLAQELRYVHRAIAEVLESLRPDAVEELAFHFDEAGDRPRALRYHDRAAAVAEGMFAFVQSASHLERAIDLVPSNDPTLAELHLRLAEALWRLSLPARAARAAETARALFAARGDRLGESRALIRMALCFSARGITDQKREVEFARAAVAVVATVPEGAQVAEIYGIAGMSICFAATSLPPAEERPAWMREARDLGEAALAMARRVQSERALATALHTLGMIEYFLDSSDGTALLRECVKHVDAIPDLAHVAFNNLYVGLVRFGASSQERAAAFAQWSAFNLRHSYWPENFVMARVVRALEEPDWDGALDAASEVGPETTLVTMVIGLHRSLIVTAREGPQLGLAAAEHELGNLRSVDDAWRRSVEWPALRAWWVAGRDERILEDAERNLEGPISSPLQPHMTRLYGLAAATRHGDERARCAWLDRIDGPAAFPSRLVAAAGLHAFAMAERAVDRGDLDAGVDLLKKAATVFDEDGWATSASIVRLRRTELLLKRSNRLDRSEAVREMTHLVGFWRAAKARWYVGELRDWAAARDLRIANRTPPVRHLPRVATALTERQMEIATLVAEGLTNKQIGSQLDITERTVESHLDGIRTKLGLRNRAQVASWAASRVPEEKAQDGSTRAG